MGESRPIATTALSELRLERHPYHGRVVVKRALEHTAGSSHVFWYWRREFEALLRFKHPGVIPLLDADLDAPQPWLMFPYIEAPTLRDLMRGDRPWTLSALEFLQVLDQILNVLAVIHEGDASETERVPYLHGDINPRNVLVDKENHVTLIDFALCRPSPAPAEKEGLIGPGTPEYMSPARRQGLSYDVTDDLYAVAAMAAKALGINTEPLSRSATPRKSVVEASPDAEDRIKEWVLDVMENYDKSGMSASDLSWKLAKIVGNL